MNRDTVNLKGESGDAAAGASMLGGAHLPARRRPGPSQPLAAARAAPAVPSTQQTASPVALHRPSLSAAPCAQPAEAGRGLVRPNSGRLPHRPGLNPAQGGRGGGCVCPAHSGVMGPSTGEALTRCNPTRERQSSRERQALRFFGLAPLAHAPPQSANASASVTHTHMWPTGC